MPKKKKLKSNWKIQSLLFNKKCYSPSQAKKWAKKYKFRYSKIDVADADKEKDAKKKYHRIRQASPKRFSKFRTIKLSGCIKAVLGKVKKIKK